MENRTEKEKYFWEQMNGRDFGLNEINNEIFIYILIFNEPVVHLVIHILFCNNAS